MNLTPKYKIRRAINRIFDQHPLFACIVAKWNLIPDESIGTMATNGQSLMFCPTFVEKLTIEELTWVVLHEAGHVFLGHHLRLHGEPRKLANVAADLALNDLIKQTMPAGCLQQIACIPGKEPFAGLPSMRDAETYVRLLKDKAQPTPPPKQPDEEQQESDEEGDGQGDGQGQSDESDAEQDDGDKADDGAGEDQDGGDAQSDDDAQVGGGGDEQGAGEETSPGKPSASSQAAEKMLADMGVEDGVGVVLPHPELEGEDADPVRVETEWQETVAQAVNTAKTYGNLPGSFFEKWERSFGKSKVSWRQLLRRWMTKMTRDGFSYSRPNRRSGWRRDVILPVRRGRNAGRGVVIVDTSGSMSNADCNVALRELESILRQFPKSEVVMIQCDTKAITEAERVFKREDFPLKTGNKAGSWYGRGGTNLNPAFDRVKEHGRQVRWCVVVSDMLWNYHGAPDPKLPTLWLAVGCRKGHKPKFGTVIEVEHAKETK